MAGTLNNSAHPCHVHRHHTVPLILGCGRLVRWRSVGKASVWDLSHSQAKRSFSPSPLLLAIPMPFLYSPRISLVILRSYDSSSPAAPCPIAHMTLLPQLHHAPSCGILRSAGSCIHLCAQVSLASRPLVHPANQSSRIHANVEH